jgi:Uncharacterized protein conserved in bacteria
MDLKELGEMPHDERSALNAAHWALNDTLRDSGNFLIAEALDPPDAAACIRVRNGNATVTDGPFAETKEMIAGFYVIEARDMKEALDIASRIPAAALGTIEVRPACQLEVEGQVPRWG